MMMTRTRMALCATAVAVAVPATYALSQSGQQGQADRPPQQQQTQQQPRLNGQQSQPMTAEQARMWFEHTASNNQFEIETSKLAAERFGGQMGQQPGQNDPARPGGAAGGQSDPGARSDSSRGQQDPGQADAQRDPQLAGAQVGQRQTGMQGQEQQLAQAAQTIMRDHEQAQQALRQAAERAGVQISETPELSPVHQAKLEELREKQGDEFKRHWVFANMGGHTHAILEYTWAQQKGTPEIKEYAGQVLPKLQQHAQHLAPIAYQIAGIENARTAGERMGDDAQRPGQNQGQRPGSGSGGTDRPGSGAGGGDR
jgi:predicted outer membrane protein